MDFEGRRLLQNLPDIDIADPDRWVDAYYDEKSPVTFGEILYQYWTAVKCDSELFNKGVRSLWGAFVSRSFGKFDEDEPFDPWDQVVPVIYQLEVDGNTTQDVDKFLTAIVIAKIGISERRDYPISIAEVEELNALVRIKFRGESYFTLKGVSDMGLQPIEGNLADDPLMKAALYLDLNEQDATWEAFKSIRGYLQSVEGSFEEVALFFARECKRREITLAENLQLRQAKMRLLDILRIGIDSFLVPRYGKPKINTNPLLSKYVYEKLEYLLIVEFLQNESFFEGNDFGEESAPWN